MGQVLVASCDRSLWNEVEQSAHARGHVVVTTDDAQSAIDILTRAQPPELALITLRMRGRSGVDVLKAVRAAGSHVPTVLLAPDWEADERKHAQRLGAQEVVKLPVAKERLVALISRFVPDEEPARGNPLIEPQRVSRLTDLQPLATNVRALDTTASQTRACSLMPELAPAHVLVVDSNRAVGALLEYCLRRQGFRVSRVATATAALELAQTDTPAVAIVGMRATSLGHTRLLEQVRRRSSADLAVVVIYDRQLSGEAVYALDLGADLAIPDAFDPELLFAQLRALLRTRTRAAKRTRAGAVPVCALRFNPEMVELNGETPNEAF